VLRFYVVKVVVAGDFQNAPGHKVRGGGKRGVFLPVADERAETSVKFKALDPSVMTLKRA
jgi:hypothetical protein